MSRPVMFISAGTAALLVALFVLWQSIRSSGSEPIGPPRLANEPAPAATPPPPPTAPAAPAPTRAARPPAVAAPTPPRITATPSPLPPPPPPPAEAAPVAAPTNLHFGMTQLRAQTKAVEPLVRECIDKAANAGVRPTGSVTLTYEVVKHEDKYEIENTGVDYGKTTVDNDALLECLHQTAKGMKFVGLPNNLTAITAARRVTLENGEMTENAHVTFRSLRR